MRRTSLQLRADAERIWRAGVAAVMPERLMQSHVRVDGDRLLVDEEAMDLRGVERIAIVGAGKAAGAMARALESVLGPRLLSEKRVTGWVNVPADCVLQTRNVTIHPARPAGVNEPRPEGLEGTRRILEVVSSLRPSDLCFCVLTGGGSALLPAPVPGISLDEKIRLTRLLSAAGANIEQLNAVRRQISLVKGGGLARACNAGRLVTLVISDVLGDPLDAIASGPTVVNPGSSADEALAVLEDLRLLDDPSIGSIVGHLRQRASDTMSLSQNPLPGGGGQGEGSIGIGSNVRSSPHARVSHHLLGNNATAVDAAGTEAERLGYSHAMISAAKPEGPAEDVGRHLANMALQMRGEPGPDCLISGGEPTVSLAEESRRGKGGRNQQLALAALTALGDCHGIALLAGGTDGEDGPTDAAGAFVTQEVVDAARSRALDARDYLARNDAYNFFLPAGGLLITGPTQTNVCDLRVVVVDQT